MEVRCGPLGDADRERATIDVREFATATQLAADSTTAIMAAIGQLPPLGGVVEFAPGTYSVPNGLTTLTQPGLTIRGYGPNSTFLKINHATNHLLNFEGGNPDWFTLENITLTQLHASGTGVALRMVGAAPPFYIRSPLIRNVDFSGFKKAIYIEQALHVRADHLRLNGQGQGVSGSLQVELEAVNGGTLSDVYANNTETGFKLDGASITLIQPITELTTTGIINDVGSALIIRPLFTTTTTHIQANAAVCVVGYTPPYEITFAGGASGTVAMRSIIIPATDDTLGGHARLGQVVSIGGYFFWPDSAGKFRMHTSAPSAFGSTAEGTIVGTQS